MPRDLRDIDEARRRQLAHMAAASKLRPVVDAGSLSMSVTTLARGAAGVGALAGMVSLVVVASLRRRARRA